MKKLNIKTCYLIILTFTIFTWILLVQDGITSGLMKSANAGQALQSTAEKFFIDEHSSVAFSPDGKILASADSDGQILLWDIASGQLRMTLPSQSANTVRSMVFSPGGNLLASVSDNSIRLWDTISGDIHLELPLSAPVINLVFSPDGRTFAAVDEDDRITLKNLESGSTTQIVTGHQNGVNAVVISPDNITLVTGGEDARIKLWDMETGREQTALSVDSGTPITKLLFSPDGNTLAALDQTDRITIRDSQSGSITQVLTGHQSGINAIAFSPDNNILASGGQDAQIKLWDRATGQIHATLPGESDAVVTSLVFSPDGKTLTGASKSEQVFLWDVANKSSRLLTGHRDWVIKVVFGSNYNTLASMDKTGQVIVWDLITGMAQLNIQVPLFGVVGLSQQQAVVENTNTNSLTAADGGTALPNTNNKAVIETALSPNALSINIKKSIHDWKGVTALAVSPNGTLLGGATRDGKAMLWDSKGTELFAISEHHGAAVTGVVFSVDGNSLLSVARDTEVQMRDVKNGKKNQTLLAHEHPIRSVAASPSGQFYASAGEETRVMLWDAKNGKLSRILSGGHIDFVNAVSFSADGNRLASAGADGRIVLWDVKTGKVLQTLLGHASEVNTVAFSQDGRLLASGSADSRVILWDAATGKQIESFAGHQAAVRTVSFSTNGQTLASAGEDTKILVWDMATRKLVKQIAGSTSVINALAFTPSGNLIAGNENSEVINWDVNKGLILQIIKIPLQLLSKNSEGWPSAGSVEPNQLLAFGNTREIAQSASIKSTNTGLIQALTRVLDWIIPSAEAALSNPDQGTGGPILVITSNSSTFSKYYPEILRTEGLNEFAVADISSVTATTLAAYDVVILAPATLTSTQVTMFSDWVTAGGNLIAMRPDSQLAGLLGLTSAGSILANGYLLVNTSNAPGNGIVDQTMQFHGTADRYNLNGVTSLATLYSNATTATTNPAVTVRSVGSNGGQAASFSYDLATSIVYTRQGNPVWATQERDGFVPIRSDDKFYGNASGDPQADWVDLTKLAIPQADEQQRLLANLILEMNRDKKPLPRFWYFPRGKKAVVIMTGDDHGNNGTEGRFNQFLAASPAGCSVANWECIRGTSYIFPNTPLTPATASAFNAQGFEVGLHINTNCGDFTPSQLEDFYSQQISAWKSAFQSGTNPIPDPITQRHHCIAWSDWVTGAKVQLNHGIRLDTSYYFWPPSWVQNRPGFFSGSGMPMRFSDLDGTLIDVFHVTSQMTDESGQQYPFTIDTLLDRALGTEGYYGAFTINAHTDVTQIPESDAVLASAPPRGVPIVSSKQMLDWLDARNSSSFGAIAWSSNSLSFTVAPGTGANGLQVLLPMTSAAGILTTITRDGAPVTFTTDVIKGISYGAFSGTAGLYVATYAADAAAPTVTSKTPVDGTIGVSQGTVITATFSEPMDASTISSSSFELRKPDNSLVPATVSYNASTRTATLTPSASLAASTTFTATVKGGAADPRVKDLAGNALGANVTWSFTTEAQPCASASCSAWSSSTVPSNTAVNDPNAVELGVKFRSDIDGFVTGIRFYKGSTNTGTHIGTLWSNSGSQMATATFSNETASGWQQVNFSAPVPVTANTVYVASYFAPNGNYAADNNYFATTGVNNGPIHLLQDGISGGNGLYAYSASSSFPTNTYQSSNYWVDVVFTTNTGPDTTSPTVMAQSPTPDATGVATNTSVTATFSETMDATTITSSTFELRDSANALVSATVTYDGTTKTATLTPGVALIAGASYTATVKGGATDPTVKDSAGNELVANVTWSFTIAPAGTQACTNTTSIWPANPTPSLISDPDTSPIELGVKFRSNVNGYVCGIRFYKGGSNTGTHVGNLWNSDGTLKATATFTNETASGWQQMSFATPVAITANTTYVASYHTQVGRYSVNENYFTSGVNNNPLYAFSTTENGGNGLYLYGSDGFPTNTFSASNYWVDVIFTTSTGPDTTPPTISSTSPATGATGVIPANPVTATFSEAIDGATVSSSTFELRDPSNTLVPASYTTANNIATMTPSSPLADNTIYNATLKGGVNGVRDLAGNTLAAVYTWSFTTGVNPCSSGGNPVVCENSKTGNPSSEWDVSGAGDASIQGFATDISVNRGSTVSFKINTNASAYRLDIYRMGYYGGLGARKMDTVMPSVTLPQTQPNCLINATTGLIDCGNWAVSASWTVPPEATSGIYFAKLTRTDTGGASHIVFIVRDDASTSDILFQTSDTTWQAYNNYGGNSLYTGSPAGRAYKVSYNRPFNTRAVDGGQDWLFNAEYPMVRWLEANGYNVSYFTGVDADRFGNLIKNHKIFLSVGHDEYWSKQQRDNVEKARDNALLNQVNPVNLAFFSGNEVFWKTRWENSIDPSSTSYRTLVCYKETHANAKIDPSPEWTGTWRDPRFSPPADGGRPENSLTGTIFTVNDGATTSIEVPEADGKMRFWRGTSIANLTPGSTVTLPNGTLGYEWDEDLDNGARPEGLMRLSTTTVAGAPVLLDYGSAYGSGTAVHSLTMYRAESGALVFGAGTVQWPWGLDNTHDRPGTPTNSSMQQATVNLFADMGVQPATLQSGLTAATASADTAPPSSTITSPANGSTVAVGSNVVISGTAADAGGGQVGGIEISTDGGTTWHPVAGRSNWTYNWTPNADGSFNIKSRAVDDSLNLQPPVAGITITVGTGVDTQAPTAPGNLTASVTSGTQISLNWTASTDNVAVTGYRVERCQGAGCSIFGEIGTATTVNFTDSGITAGTTYSYRVRAVDAVPLFSGYSNIAETTTNSVPINSVPIAVNDTFLYRANVLRTVNAPGPLGLGVLINDTHPQNLPLTAQLVAGSLSGGGTLNLASNGSFTYLRAKGSNTVNFRYRASDGSALSEPATGATVNLRVDAAPTTAADNCSYDRSANTVTQPLRCTVTGTRAVKMNVVLNDTDSNVTTNVPTDDIGQTVVPSTMVVTVAGTGVTVNANAACGQGALGLLASNATIINNCDGTLTVTMTAINTSNITYSYRVSDDLGAQSAARAVTLSSVQ